MTPREAPKLDSRRTEDLRAELQERARAWIRDWNSADAKGGFGDALLDIAARFASQVTERLDRAGEKLSLGLLDWLGMRGKAATPARVPVVFRLADGASPVLATKPVQLQADAEGATVVFETEADVKLVPGSIDALVGIDTASDAYFLPPPGLTSLDTLLPAPTQWTLKSFVSRGATHVQLDPAVGIERDMLLEISGAHYRVTAVDDDLVAIDPAIVAAAGIEEDATVRKVETFEPFAAAARNQQQHAVYLGDVDLFNLEAPAVIELQGARALSSAQFEYFGKTDQDDEPKWHELTKDASNEPGSDTVVLKKPRGAVEPTGVGAIESSRWIRALQAKVDSEQGILLTDAIKVVLKSNSASDTCPASRSASEPGPLTEGFANTTPIVFTSAFYPLGREPKQFDTFYLACSDAFSKRDAEVSICFEMANMAALSFSTLREGLGAQRLLAGVGGDGALHLLELEPNKDVLKRFRNHEPLQPKSEAGSAVGLDAKPGYRLPMWAVNHDNTTVPNKAEVALLLSTFTNNPIGGSLGALFGVIAGGLYLYSSPFVVATSAGNTVWLRREYPFSPNDSKWISLAPLPDASEARVDGLVYLRDGDDAAGAKLYAAWGGQLFSHSAALGDATSAWDPVVLIDPPLKNNVPLKLKRISPVESYDLEDRWHGTLSDGLVAMFSDQADAFVYFIDQAGKCTPIETASNATSSETCPAAARIGTNKFVFWVRGDNPAQLRAKKFTGASPPVVSDADAPTVLPERIAGESLHVPPTTGAATVLATGRQGTDSWILRWEPFATPPTYVETMLPAGVGPLDGSPTLLDKHILVPGTQSEVFLARWNPSQRKEFTANLRSGIATATTFIPPVAAGDYVAIEGSDDSAKRAEVGSLSKEHDGERFHALTTEFGVGETNARLVLFRRAVSLTFTGGWLAADKIGRGENVVVDDEWLLVEDANQVMRVLQVDVADSTGITFQQNPGLPNGMVRYWRAEPLQARIAPYMELNPYSEGNWNAQLLDQAGLAFDGRKPAIQRGRAFDTAGPDKHPTLVVLDFVWLNPPGNGNGNNVACLLDASVGEWTRQLGARTANPELTWEYFDGTTWARLTSIIDGTLDFQRTGQLIFKVPTNLRPTDVSGKTNYWIRARLTRGDYGRERVTVRTVPDPTDPKATIQEVIRDATDFHPPLVVAMRVGYEVKAQVLPTYVLTQDSGSTRDQSDANRTPDALVEALVPLSVLMERLTPDTPPGRALLIGLSSMLEGDPINILLLVQERDHDDFAPLTVEALVNDRFERLPVRDTTRAAGESGLLSLSFAVKPNPRDLFGKTLTWLRLSPSRHPTGREWAPVIRGAYINAAWASATETLTREALGSSDGRPLLAVQVARPPLLQDSLELRVREPLDEEERGDLLSLAKDNVKFTEPDLPGDWVLWKQVPNPTDCGPDDRVYALDEISGEIQFGDGLHGKIPPIGRDSIVAFSYQRTEPPAAGSDRVPANFVPARTVLQLVTPVEGVEAAVAADRAAGGSLPESSERVLRFGNARLRHRERAIALQDFEDLALQTSADIAQARAFRSNDGLRIVVVMRGANPMPDASQRRELERALQKSASPLLSDIRIQGPRVRRLRLHLTLRVDTLEDAGTLATATRLAVAKFFDSVSGGPASTGWPLGAAPAEDDIALALDDAPGLAGIADIQFKEIDSTGSELAWREQFRPDELVLLAQDAIRINFETLEAQA